MLFTRVSPLKLQNSKISASASEPHDWIDLGFHACVLGQATHQVFATKPYGIPQPLFGVSHGNLSGRSQPGGCNPGEITMTFQLRNTFPSDAKTL